MSNNYDSSTLSLFNTEFNEQTAILLEIFTKGIIDSEEEYQQVLSSLRSLVTISQITELSFFIDLFEAIESIILNYKLESLQKENKVLIELNIFILQISDFPINSPEKFENWFSEKKIFNDKIQTILQESIRNTEAQIKVTETNTNADYVDYSMLDLFLNEISTNIMVFNEFLLKIEDSPANIEFIEPLMRAAHSLKGAARIMQMDVIVDLTHSMEDLFVKAQNKEIVLTETDIDISLKAVDVFSQMLEIQSSEISNWLISQNENIYRINNEIKNRKLSHKPKEIVAQKKENFPSDSLPIVCEQSPSEIKISIKKLGKILGLSSQVMIENKWLDSFTESLLKIKRNSFSMLKDFDEVTNNIPVENKKLFSKFLTKVSKELSQNITDITNNINYLGQYSRKMSNITEKLYGNVVSLRMRPFSDLTSQYQRRVRDLAKNLGKRVKIQINGKNTDVDRDILAKLEAPLNHLLRNSIDHGIESPEIRIMNGKSETGLITISAFHKNGMLNIDINDDGNGISIDKIKQKIVDKKLSTKEIIENLNKEEILNFLFLPGFSTRDFVTEFSGRGVGLDVVQSMIQAVNGSIFIESETGIGTTFHLTLPLTLSIVRTLLVTISDEYYAFPLTKIEKVLQINQKEIQTAEGRKYFTFNNEKIGLISAAEVLELKTRPITSGKIPIILLKKNQFIYGLIIEKFIGERELVVRPLNKLLGKIADINSTAILDNGSPVLIIDVEDMYLSIDKKLNAGLLKDINLNYKNNSSEKKRILIVDDSITVRELEKKILEKSGYYAETAIDGIDGLNSLKAGNFDLLISDIDMPRMNGFELVQEVRKNKNYSKIPIIIVSYKDRESDKLKGLEAGADYYLTKSSFQDRRFLIAVEDLIGKANN